MYANGIWSPICGHWFWDTHYGATLFCQKLGSNYVSGTVTRSRGKKLEQDAIRVGKCRNNDRWMQCSGGCNDLGYGHGCARCEAGQRHSALKSKKNKNKNRTIVVHFNRDIIRGWGLR